MMQRTFWGRWARRGGTWGRRAGWLAAGLVAAGCGPDAGVAERSALAEEEAASARPAAAIYDACQLCHSTREMQRGPILDGWPAWYVESQLRKFAAGIRGTNAANRSEFLMGSGASILTNRAERLAVSAHIESLPVPLHLRTVKGDRARGKGVYQTCLACHGARGEGNRLALGPPLAPMEDWYQLDQLMKFQSGMRGGDPRDVEGRTMRAAVTGLSGEQMRDVVAYIAWELAVGEEARAASARPAVE